MKVRPYFLPFILLYLLLMGCSNPDSSGHWHTADATFHTYDFIGDSVKIDRFDSCCADAGKIRIQGKKIVFNTGYRDQEEFYLNVEKNHLTLFGYDTIHLFRKDSCLFIDDHFSNAMIKINLPHIPTIISTDTSAISHIILVGKPKEKFEKLYGTETRIQVNDVLIDFEDIPQFVIPHYPSMEKIVVQLSIDKNTPMAFVNKIQDKLKESQALKVAYSVNSSNNGHLTFLNKLLNYICSDEEHHRNYFNAPPPPPQKDNFPCYHHKVKGYQNSIKVQLKADGSIFINSRKAALEEIKEKAIAFLLEHKGKKQRPLILFNFEDEATYEHYISISNELYNAVFELQNNFSKRNFRKPYQAIINQAERKQVLEAFSLHQIEELSTLDKEIINNIPDPPKGNQQNPF